MRRGALIAFVVGVLAFVAAIVLAFTIGIAMMPSYLAAWLFWTALPFGALPLLMGMELAGASWSAPVAVALRRLLILAPVAALFVVPVLVKMPALYGWLGAPKETGLASDWLTHGFFIGRTIAYLVIWVVFSLLFARAPTPERRRSGLAILGLVLYAIVATLASFDWAMSLDIHIHSSEYGLLFIAAQCGIALSAAVLMSGEAFRIAGRTREVGVLLLGLVSVWTYLHFMQYLVIWSADLPREVVWYINRDAGGGRIAEWIALTLGFIVPFFVLLSSDLRRSHGVLTVLAVMILLAHLLEMLWLITPSFRNHFTVSGADVLAMFGIGGITIGFLLALEAWRPGLRMERVRHG